MTTDTTGNLLAFKPCDLNLSLEEGKRKLATLFIMNSSLLIIKVFLFWLLFVDCLKAAKRAKALFKLDCSTHSIMSHTQICFLWSRVFLFSFPSPPQPIWARQCEHQYVIQEQDITEHQQSSQLDKSAEKSKPAAMNNVHSPLTATGSHLGATNAGLGVLQLQYSCIFPRTALIAIGIDTKNYCKGKYRSTVSWYFYRSF